MPLLHRRSVPRLAQADLFICIGTVTSRARKFGTKIASVSDADSAGPERMVALEVRVGGETLGGQGQRRFCGECPTGRLLDQESAVEHKNGWTLGPCSYEQNGTNGGANRPEDRSQQKCDRIRGSRVGEAWERENSARE
ncbi:hypothetical protein TRVL_07118 [Trypanosoma vivax]|nr:hypothetical protein TRVL_07118 [Trypanosoma vivax]